MRDPDMKLNQVTERNRLSEHVVELVIHSPMIAAKRQAGHFVIVKTGIEGERIPLTIAKSDPLQGTIHLIVQRVGVTSHKVAALQPGDVVTDLVGPLGQPTHISKTGTVLCAGGGVGVAPLLPIVEALRLAGNRVVCVLAARRKDLIILEKEIRHHANDVVIMTDDGSYGLQGLVTEGMEAVIQREPVHQAFVIGPAVMMKFASMLTARYQIPTQASLNAIMVDGTGMCGACRVTVAGKTAFVCVDGPEFNAHDVDFDELLMRLGGLRTEEQKLYHEFLSSGNQKNQPA